MRQSPLVRALAASLLLVPLSAVAISDDEVNRALQFNFSNPGARSLALGGAFTGLADDATAAYANPAGLTILRAPELGLELRHTGFDTPFVSGGEIVNNPFNTSGVGEGIGSDSVTQASFASFVYPLESATLAVYYHRTGDFDGSIDAAPIEFVDTAGNFFDQYPAARGRISYEIENIGFAVGYKFSDAFSVGASIAYSDFTIDSVTERDDPPITIQRQNGNDDDVIFSVGALWALSPKLNLGLAYRSGGDFSYAANNELLVDPFGELNFTPGFKVPHVLSLGLAYRPSDAWLFSFDVNHIEYSRLSDNLVTVFNGELPPLSIDDGTEIRFGVEYALLEMSTPLFLRAGVWRDPDHRLAFDAQAPGDCSLDFALCAAAALYPSGDDETHFSVGIGWAFEKFQLDFAADLSDLVDTYSASGVVRF